MTDERLKHSFARDVVAAEAGRMNPVVCMAADPRSTTCSGLGKKGEFVQGMRVTDAET